MFVMWSCVRTKVEISRESNWFKSPITYTAVRSKADIMMLITFVVILALCSPAVFFGYCFHVVMLALWLFCFLSACIVVLF